MIRFMKWGSIETTNQPRSAASLDWANRKRLYLSVPLFRNNRFMFDEMTWQNASKFAISYI